MTRRIPAFFALALLIVCVTAAPALAAPTAASVGEKIFFDTNLSQPVGQSCASCHSPAAGFGEPDQNLPVSEGAVAGRFGNRQSPSAAYAAYIPPFSYDPMTGRFRGGQFWDGRANDLVEQAKGPFLNPVEMNMPSKAAVVSRVAASAYAKDFKAVYGSNSLSLTNVEGAYTRIASAIAAYEKTSKVNPFTSKFDYAMSLSGPQRMSVFTAQERQGMMLFNMAGCSTCHSHMGMGGGGMGGGGGGMGGGGMGGGGMGMMGSGTFSDYRYANLGLPKNWASPFLTMPAPFNPDGLAYIDHGLGGRSIAGVDPASVDGMFRTPSLRNVAKTGPYGHNGYFKTLKEIVHFYNTRDVADWDPPEVAANLETTGVGDLGLTNAEEDAIVAFLGTLSDGWWRR